MKIKRQKAKGKYQKVGTFFFLYPKKPVPHFCLLPICIKAAFCLLISLWSVMAQNSTNNQTSRPRARDLGINVGILSPGKNNAITDVPGVRVGHTTLIKGDNVRT